MTSDRSIVCRHNGKYMPLAEATVPVLTHAFSYGTACFEGIRGYFNQTQQQLYLFRPIEHYQRLLHSARVLMMSERCSVEDLLSYTMECIRQSCLREDVYIRSVIYKTTQTISVRLHDLEDDLLIIVQPYGNYIDVDRELHVCISSWKRINDNVIPARAKISGGYINSAFAKTEALMSGFDEAIMLNAEGNVCEGSAENLFILRNQTLYTPPVSEDILEGITRDTIMRLAQEMLDIPVVERAIDRSELYVADEMFLCGTGAQIAPVGRIDHRLIGGGGIGPITARLQQLYLDAARGYIERYMDWCMPVFGSNMSD